jgi:hypothetical protein
MASSRVCLLEFNDSIRECPGDQLNPEFKVFPRFKKNLPPDYFDRRVGEN